MIQHPGRILTAILTLFLFPISQSFAITIFVNGANATNGSGSSWADPYNNLQSAIAAAHTGDQIWIAQGTYYPSVPAGRAATFANTNGYTIYGGFNGTESSTTQANPTLYPTILSGDIGTPGDPSDNCYHVITQTNLWYGSYNGLTIRDGRADAAAFPDNTGGGVLFLAANSGQAAANYFNNCIFSNNYAVYGGAIGAYGGSNAIQINYGATNCFFHDNQAIDGGVVYNTINNTASLYTFENDIFYNNTASSGNTSVFSNSVTNSSTAPYFRMENCLFYNEAIPILTNNYTNSGTTAPQTNYNIIWTSGTPYTAGISAGNNPIVISNSDISGTLPSGSDFDADPLFVNAAGYDFHVSPCSPVIDAGPFSSPTTYDIGGSLRKQGPLVDIGPYETLKGTQAAEPTATTPVSLCQNSTATSLSATGTNLNWYTTATGGTSSTTAPTPTTTTTGTIPYYVTQTPSGTCESNRLEIDVTVNSQPSVPTVGPGPSYCENVTAATLTATGTGLKWYTTATGGSGSSTAPTPATTSPGFFTWYVTQTTSGCESQRAPITVTVTSPSPAPTASPVTPYCENAAATPLTATGTNLKWYATATGGSGSSTAPTPGTASTGIFPYYVTQTPAGTCESGRLEIDVTVNPQPTEPTFTPIPPYCVNDIATALTVTGTSLKWYTTAAGGSGSTTAPTPITTSPGIFTWFVTQTSNGCESLRSPVSITVTSPSAIPTANPVTPYCENTDAVALTAVGTDLKWYTTATGGSSSPTAPIPSTTVLGTTPYYVTQTSAGACESSRLEIDVTVNPQPTAPTFTPIAPYCENATAAPLTATGTDLKWYITAAGGSGNTTAPTPTTTSPGIFSWFVTQTANGCESQRTPVTVTVNPIPKITIDPITGSLCAGNSIKLQAQGADNYQWSPASGLTDPTASDPIAQLQGDIQYIVTGTTDGCSATADVSLTVSASCMGTGYYIPNAFSPNGDGRNDVFRVKTGDVPKSFSMTVFNRYGGKIFETADIGSGWNGAIDGNIAPAGAYVYSVVLTTSAGEILKKNGTIILIR